MIGFGIDEIQAEYVAEIKLRHLNREYIMKRLQDVEELTKEIAEMEDTLSSKTKIKRSLLPNLKRCRRSTGSPERAKLFMQTKLKTMMMNLSRMFRITRLPFSLPRQDISKNYSTVPAHERRTKT